MHRESKPALVVALLALGVFVCGCPASGGSRGKMSDAVVTPPDEDAMPSDAAPHPTDTPAAKDGATTPGDGSEPPTDDGQPPTDEGCQRTCGDAECGPNGCGGVCGTCDDRAACVEGVCVVQADCEQAPTCACAFDDCGVELAIPTSMACEVLAAAPACQALLIDAYSQDGCVSCGVIPAPGFEALCTAPACAGVKDALVGTAPALVDSCGACEACIPHCDGLDCGPDSCGGECGTCEGGSSCKDGLCVPAATCETEPTCECAFTKCGVDFGVPLAAVCDLLEASPACLEKMLAQYQGGGCTSCNVVPAPGFQALCAEPECATFKSSFGAVAPDVVLACEACANCEPQCAGLDCGSDGCGGSCGECPSGWTCSEGTCIQDPFPNGEACASAAQCLNGSCVDGVCCDTACPGACEACDQPESKGTCTVVPAGDAGAAECAPYVCDGQSKGCPATCTTAAQCVDGAECVEGKCQTADPCAGLTLEGCCTTDGASVTWCQNGKSYKTQCKNDVFSDGVAVCGWSEKQGYYQCQHHASSAPSDHPYLCAGATCGDTCAGKQCGWTCGKNCGTCGGGMFCNDNHACESCACGNAVCGVKCGQSCGTCADGFQCTAGQCVSTSCGGITYQGCCDGDQAKFCQANTLKSLDCAAGACGWKADTGLYTCGGSGEDPSGNNPKTCP